MSSYKFNIEGAPDYSYLNVEIPAEETLVVEASSMASMDCNLSMKTKLKGGLKRFLSKESLFINEFTATGTNGEISIAPGTPGDIAHINLNNDKAIFLSASSFLACSQSIQRDTEFQGLAKGFFSGESFFLIKCHGVGDVWFNSFGAIFEVDVKGKYVVDTGHIVAFEEGLEYDISKVGGYKSLFFSGEGFVCRFKGEGKIWIQTKCPMGFVNWADAYRPVEKSND